MPVTFSNGISTTFSATTTYNNFGNPYFIPLFGSPGISSAKIYVDLTTTQDDYVDLSCITVADIQEISNYILGTVSLSSHQKVAADVNIDGSISIFDMVEIYNTILGYQNYFNNSIIINGAAYTNVSAVYPTQSDLNQINGSTFNIQYTSMYEYSPFPSNSLIGQNFIAIRLGDVNQTCNSFFALLEPEYDSYFCMIEDLLD